LLRVEKPSPKGEEDRKNKSNKNLRRGKKNSFAGKMLIVKEASSDTKKEKQDRIQCRAAVRASYARKERRSG